MKGGIYLKKKFATIIEEELIKKLKIEAVEKGLRFNDLLEQILTQYFDLKSKK
jgi:predicted DNA binding CopG/RHH family protein